MPSIRINILAEGRAEPIPTQGGNHPRSVFGKRLLSPGSNRVGLDGARAVREKSHRAQHAPSLSDRQFHGVRLQHEGVLTPDSH